MAGERALPGKREVRNAGTECVQLSQPVPLCNLYWPVLEARHSSIDTSKYARHCGIVQHCNMLLDSSERSPSIDHIPTQLGSNGHRNPCRERGCPYQEFRHSRLPELHK